jgi:hypothetical protein
MFESLSTSTHYGEVLAADPYALADRAKGLQARRDRLDAEEAELLIEVELLRAKGRSYFRDTAAWLHECGIEPEILPDHTLRMVPIPLNPAPQRRRPRDLTMGTSPPDPVPTRD